MRVTREDPTGEVHNYLTNMGNSGRHNTQGKILYEYSCACGNVVYLRLSDVRAGRRKSCGCAQHVPKVKVIQSFSAYQQWRDSINRN